MLINGVEFYDENEIFEIYKDALHTTKIVCEELAKKGYVFTANNNSHMDLAVKWEKLEIKRIGTRGGKKSPRMLCAVKKP